MSAADQPIEQAGEIEYGGECLLRAGSASVLPDILYVQHSCSRNELVPRGSPGKLLGDALIGNTDPAATSGQIFGLVPQWAKDYAGLEAHERDHVRRLISTTFGLLSHAFRAQLLSAVRDMVIESAKGPRKLTLPLALMAGHIGVGPLTPSQRAASAVCLRSAVEDRVAIGEFREVEPLFAGWMAKGCTYVSTDLPGDPPYASLAITNAGPAKWLTGRHLLELFGCCEHGNRLLGTGSGLDEVIELLSDIQRTYTLPMLIWYTQFSSRRNEGKPNGGHTRPGELYLGFYRQFPLELYVAADLALWPPFTPEGLVGKNGPINWTDISPAFRFARVLHAFKALNIEPADWPEGDLNEIVPALQQRVCDRLGWPMPAELAARWYEHLSSRNTTWFAEPAVGGFRYATTLQLLALRRDRPGDVVVNNIDYNALGVGRVPGVITREPGNGLMPITLTTAVDRQATEFWLGVYSLLPALLEPNVARLQFLRRCLPQMRQACIDAFDTWGRAAAGWPSDQFRAAVAELLECKEPGKADSVRS